VKAAREMGRSLVQYDALRAVRALGIETARTAFAHSVEDVRSLAAGMTPPVVLKIECRQLMHKSDAGGVKMGLKTPQEALQAAIAMEDGVRQAVPGAVIDGFVLQETAPSGVELFVGAGRDASFGPFVTVGLGGIFVEVLRDVATRLAPFDRETAAEMLRSLKGYSLLDGARGRPKCDIDAVCDALTRISALAAFEPSVRSMDINPLIVYPKGLGLLVLDARMVIGN
jgi:acetyltransferase